MANVTYARTFTGALCQKPIFDMDNIGNDTNHDEGVYKPKTGIWGTFERQNAHATSYFIIVHNTNIHSSGSYIDVMCVSSD